MTLKKYFILFIASFLLTNSAYANWYQDIINAIIKQSGVTNGILDNELSTQRNILATQNDIEKLMKDLNGHMTSHSGWGAYQLHDYQSYGSSANSWVDVLRMAQSHQGQGVLGSTIDQVAKQFPSDVNVYNRVTSNLNNQHYYATKAETVLAVRAASQLDYNQIAEQIAYQHMLQAQIEKTQDLKAAVDLNNRIQVENNLISLSILRQLALSNEQHAITEQGSLNTALNHAKFLIKH